MSASQRTISIIIPALNEEANIADAVAEVHHAMRGRFDCYEILLFDDGSTDRTGAIMDGLASSDARLRVTHNPRPKNLGGVYKQGVAMARYEYVIMIPGDNENPSSAVVAPLDAVGRAEIVVPYVGRGKRSPVRAVVSKAYVVLMNGAFGLRLRYYNGTVIHRTANVREIVIETDSFAYQSEVLIKLLRMQKSFVEIPVDVEPARARSSKAFRARNVYGVISSVLRLFWQIRIARPKRAPELARG